MASVGTTLQLQINDDPPREIGRWRRPRPPRRFYQGFEDNVSLQYRVHPERSEVAFNSPKAAQTIQAPFPGLRLVLVGRGRSSRQRYFVIIGRYSVEGAV